VFTHLLNLSRNENANYAVKIIATKGLQTLVGYNANNGNNAINPSNYAIFLLMQEMIAHPKDVVLPSVKDIPPGAPIGENEN